MSILKYRRGVSAPAPESYVGPLMQAGPDRLEAALSNLTSGRSLPPSELLDAKIKFDLERGSRHVFTGAKIWKTSRYPSQKARRTLEIEGGPEQLLAMESEVDVGITDYRTQPFTMTFSMSGSAQVYTPDFIRLRADGQIEIIEVKARMQDFLKEGYIEKLLGAENIFNAIGWSFLHVVRDGHSSHSFFDQNVNFIQHCRFVDLPEVLSARLCIAARAKSGPSLTYSGAVEILGGGHLGQSRLFKSIVCRLVSCDISQPLALDTPIYLAG
jgi:hypothetical protein